MAPNENSAEANFCGEFFEQTRDELIASHRWNFAATRATLSQISEPPLFGYCFQYALPSDCLRVVQLNGCDFWWGFGDDDDNERVYVIEGKNLLTNQAEAQIRYLARITDCSLYPPLFIEALALKLAAVIAKPLTGSSDQAASLLQIFERVTLPRAIQTDAIEGKPRRKNLFEISRLVQSRYRGTLG